MVDQNAVNMDHAARLEVLEHQHKEEKEARQAMAQDQKVMARELTSIRQGMWALVIAAALNGGMEGAVQFLERFSRVFKALI